MTRPFTPRDTLRLLRQQGAGTALELEAILLLDQSPLRQLLGAWRPMRRTVETFVLDLPDGTEGFLQARCRAGVPAVDLTFIAPSLASREGAALYWARLIQESCQHLGAAGIQRVYVALDEDDRVGLQLFQQSGFKVYTTDTVFARRQGLTELPVAALEAAGMLRPATTADGWSIHRLRSAACPRDVWAHESADGRVASATGRIQGPAEADAAGEPDPWGGYPLGGHLPGEALAWVWPDAKGEVVGACRLVRGRAGNWLQAVARPETDWGTLVGGSLAAAAELGCPAQPAVVAAARGYEPQLNLALREHGFERLRGRFRLVKHLAVRVLEPAWSDRASAEMALEGQPVQLERLAHRVDAAER